MKWEELKGLSFEADEVDVKSEATLPAVLLGPKETWERGEFEVDLDVASEVLTAGLRLSSGCAVVAYLKLWGCVRW